MQKYIVEFLGTMALMLSILMTGNPLMIGATLAAAAAAVAVAAVATTVSGEWAREGTVFHPYAATGQARIAPGQ